MASSVYLDASAIVKLVVPESETPALLASLRSAALISSGVAAVEVPRAARLRGRSAATFDEAQAVLRRFYLVHLDEEIRAVAARLPPPELRTLDAIHLASALQVRDRVDAFVVYDRRLASAARANGFTVEAPGFT